MLELTFLTEDQIFGKNKLDILVKYGLKAAITDFSILLGGYVADRFYTSEEKTLKNRTGCWWTKTEYSKDECVTINQDGFRNWAKVTLRGGGAHPVLPYSSISQISKNKMINSQGILEIEYGEYPQTIVDEIISHELEEAYNSGTIKKTGKTYTTDSIDYFMAHISFQARTHTEYEYKGIKYIRFAGNENCENEILSDGRTAKRGEVYWVKVEPIKWLVDEKEDIALSKKIIFAGVQFKSTCDYDGDFTKTDIYKFMNTYFLKEIVESRELTEQIESETWEDLVTEANRRLSLLKKR